MIRAHVVLSVFQRNFWSYFSGAIGYLFIIVFVTAGAWFAFREEFFTYNQANLAQLNLYFPQLLLFVVPAITMSVWSEERKLGTDELLFTLPVSDIEVLLGKYLAVIGVYSVTLLFSLTHCLVLFMIGNPDLWQLAANYLGFWLAGCALLSAGMLASYMTSSATVAFIIGLVLCLPAVFAMNLPIPAPLSSLFGNEISLETFGIRYHFQPFGNGIVRFSSLVYFASFIVLMLYINRVLIGYRHWSGGKHGSAMGIQYLIRTIALAVVLFSVNIILANVNFAFDLTQEKLYTITETTRKTLSSIKADRPVTIQAFISKQVPREYAPVRTSLIGLLGQYAQIGRGRLSVRIVDVEPFSEAADEAKAFGIEARKVQSERGGRIQMDDVYLGAVINSGANEVVIPFFDIALPIEYELTRSIQTVSEEKRRTVGILETEAKLTGGFDMQSFRSSPEWRIVTELKKQYNVEVVSPASPIDDKKYDVLIAVLPSSLTTPEMGNLVDYVRKGRPTLIFDDPIPATNVELAPRQPRPRAGGMMGGMSPPGEPKADGGKATSLVNLLGIQWNFDEVVFDNTIKVLHPEFSDVVRPEIVAISSKSGVKNAFSEASPVTSGLQEVLLFFSGTVRKRDKATVKITPLLQTGPDSGLIPWGDLVRPGFFGGGLQIVEEPPRVKDEYSHIVACRIEGDTKAGGTPVNVIYVADTDLIADWFFSVRERRLLNLDLDNVTFVLNAVDVLADDKTFIELRKRRAKARTLTAVERQTAPFVKERSDEQQKANEEAKAALDQAKERLKAEVEKIRKDDSLDDIAKIQALSIAQENESRRVQVTESNIEQEKQVKLDKIQRQTDRQIRVVEQSFFLSAFLLAPIPPAILGLVMLLLRLRNEQQDISPTRRVGSGKN
ncbi:MAG: ABC transporter permease [Planctomyces sp.]|nr:ABC transporter permease [Planctomyces sp.]